MRTIGSTVGGELADTLTFMTIVFHNLPYSIFIQLTAVQYLFKIGYEVLVTPFTYWKVAKIKKYEGMDTFDCGKIIISNSSKSSPLPYRLSYDTFPDAIIMRRKRFWEYA